MANQTETIHETTASVQNSHFLSGKLGDYFRTILEDYPTASFSRIIVYLVEGVLIGLFFYLWLEYSPTEALFRTYYPPFVAFTVIFWHYLVADTGGRLIYKRRKHINVTIGKIWGISFAGVLLGYIMVYLNGQCPGIARFYPDISSFYSSHSSPTMIRLSVFYKIVLIPWAVSTFLLTQSELKKHLASELAGIKQINDSLNQKKLRIDNEVNINKEMSQKPSDFLSIPLKDGISKIAFSDIYFIAVEDHYCKIVYNRQGETDQEYVRLSLKDALAELPTSHFVQVHRSCAVNLLHVKHVKKEGQAYQLLVEGSDHFLPASRHRAHIFLPRLKEILN